MASEFCFKTCVAMKLVDNDDNDDDDDDDELSGKIRRQF